MKTLCAIFLTSSLCLLFASSTILAATWEVSKASYHELSDKFSISGKCIGTLPDLTALDVTIRFAAFEQIIPQGSFKKEKSGYVLMANILGISQFHVKVRNGFFQILGRTDKQAFESPARVEIHAGEDHYCRLLTMTPIRGSHWFHNSTTDAQDPCDVEAPNVVITVPTHYPGFATTEPTIDIGGMASDDVAIKDIRWESNQGYSGTAHGAEEWQAFSIPLELGDNVIKVTVRDTSDNTSSDDLVVTHNTGVSFLGIPRATPDAIFAGEPTVITINVTIGISPDLDANSVKLVKVNDDGSLGDVGLLYDDGNLAHCDEIDQDGVFSGCYSFTQGVEGKEVFRVAASTLSTQNQYFYSPAFNIYTILHITDEQLGQVVENADTAKEKYGQAIAAGKNLDEALKDVLTWLKTQPEVIQAGIAESGQGLWWLENSGLLGGASFPQQGQRRGESPSERGEPELLSATPCHSNSHVLHTPVPIFEMPFSEKNGEYVGSTNAKVMASFFTQFEQWGGDETEEINQWLINSACPKFNVTYLKETQVTVDEFKNLSSYGVIAITSHGDTWYKGLLSLWTEQWGWNWLLGQVVILTGQKVTKENKAAYEKDLKQGRLAVTEGGTIAVLPSFISCYNGVFPKSVVYAGSCRSSYNNSMANSFLAAGASTYFGYTEYVDSQFAYNTGKSLFDELVNNGAATGDAFIPGQSDGKAEFVMFGSDGINLKATEIQNPSFEEGNLLGWSVDGDGRVITQLGGAKPTEGGFMGIISTGLGFTVQHGCLSQSVCFPSLPAEKTKLSLKYDWNFYSEEFLEWCGSIYQDWFDSSIDSTVYQHNDIDSLCGSVFPSDVSFDRGDVYDTGWKTATYDITSWAGKGGTLKFCTNDVGDSVFDSAILIDNIRLEVE